MTETIILPEDVKIEYRENIKGWVVDDKYYGRDEATAKRIASYDIATHKKREKCGSIISQRSYCQLCSDKSILEKYMNLEEIEWDGTFPITLHDDDKYFFNEDELYDFLEDQEEPLDYFRFNSCKENYAREIDGDYWCDDLPEDVDELPDQLEKAMEALNKVASETLLSYSPSNKRLRFNEDQIKEYKMKDIK